MSLLPQIAFSSIDAVNKGTFILLANDKLELAAGAKNGEAQVVLSRAFGIAGFSGKLASNIDVLAPAGTDVDRLIAIGAGSLAKRDDNAWLRIGGAAIAAAKKTSEIAVLADLADASPSAEDIAALALGIILGAYRFDKYKTRKTDEASAEPVAAKVTILCADPKAAERAFADARAVADGVLLARDLVNEPANVLGTLEFAEKAKALETLGVSVEILTETEMTELGMAALLGVAQGSVRPPRLVIMRWNGGKADAAPLAFIGKGVVFDSGGISIKPAASMEDMKGDMGGAAAVTGLMHVLAARKAPVNAIGVIGLVENMVDANAQRPGDIVKSMSGQTIEILNTDAEGRLVLADALWYTNERFKPRFMVDLATLTGAVIIALGHEHAGLFSNDDALAEQLFKAGQASDEKLWRLPLTSAYDKIIDAKNADVKNTGGRPAGSITAAQFLQRFVKDTPWAHLDIAGTAMGSPTSEINHSWASGFGVRLLDRFVRDNFEN